MFSFFRKKEVAYERRFGVGEEVEIMAIDIRGNEDIARFPYCLSLRCGFAKPIRALIECTGSSCWIREYVVLRSYRAQAQRSLMNFAKRKKIIKYKIIDINTDTKIRADVTTIIVRKNKLGAAVVMFYVSGIIELDSKEMIFDGEFEPSVLKILDKEMQ